MKKASRYWKFALFVLLVALIVLYVVGKYEEARLDAVRNPIVTVAETTPGVKGPAGPAAPAPAVAASVTAASPSASSAAGLTAAGAAISFEDCRLQRQRTRSLEAEQLQTLAADAEAPAETRAEASRRLLELARAASVEAEAEAALAARGYDALVFLFERGAVAVVRAASLTAQDAAFIGDVVARCAGLSLEDVTVTSRPR